MQITWIVSAKDIKVHIDLFHKNKLDHQPCRQVLVKLLKNSIKYVVSRAVLGALLGALKVALVGTLIIQSASKNIPENEGKNEYVALKFMG